MKLMIKDGSFAYEKDHPILRNIHFSAESGQIVSILGPNGAGKTTLLKCILGFLKWQGKVLLDDKPADQLHARQFWQTFAYVPQAHSQAFPYTVKETVLLGRSIYLGMFASPGKTDEAEAEKAMEMAGITHLAGKSCGQISGGELQLVLIARALAANPKILVLDEPETGLDLSNQLVIMRLLQKLAHEKGLLIVFNTHYPDHALSISDQTLLLHKDGRALYGPVGEILTKENMEDAFGVRVVIAHASQDGKEYQAMIPTNIR